MAELAASVPTSAPIPRTRLIGRETECALARSLLLDEAAPLLTLTGPGGVGKTRLALAITQDVAVYFADGAVWVDLAPLTDPALVPVAVATALGIIPTASKPLRDELAHVLRPRQTLLLLDNCEHVLAEAATLVSALLTHCPALQVLATSRSPLRLRGEQVLPVAPLGVPASGLIALEVVQEAPAVKLFVQRARGADPSFALSAANAGAVAAVCERLDGLPLALELGQCPLSPRVAGAPQPALASLRHRTTRCACSSPDGS